MDSALLRLYGATFLYSLAQAVGVPLLSEYLRLDYDMSLVFIGSVLGVYGLMQIVLRLPMGDMADRRGRKPSLLLAFACSFAAGLFFVFGPGPWWTVPGIALFGLSGGIFWVAANSYLFDRVGKGDVARATSDYSLALGLAFLVGPPLGHFVAEAWGFRAAFTTYLWTSVIALLLVVSLPETPPAPRPPSTTSSYRRAWVLLKHPALVVSAIGTFVYSALFSTTSSFFQLHALAAGFTLGAIGLLLGARQATSLLMRLGLRPLMARLGPRRALYAGIGVFSLAVAATPFATSVVSLVLVSVLSGIAAGVLIPANLMLVHEGAPPAERGLANGIYGTMLGLGSAVAPSVFGYAGAKLGLEWTFWGVAAVGVAGLVVLLARERPAAKPA